MSTDDNSDDNGSLVKGPKVNAGGVMTLQELTNNSFTSSPHSPGLGGLSRDSGWARYLGSQFDGDRQLYDVLGYEYPLRLGHYVAKYERGPGIVEGIVDKPVRDCWGDEIGVEESEDTSEDETPFEETVREILAGDYTRLPPMSRFRAADRWARLLEYSLILIGVDDDGLEEGDTDSLENPVDTDSLSGPEDINYIAFYDQRRVNWSDTRLVEGPTDPRYKLPDEYNVEISDGESVDIHHSRLLHIVENPDEDELKSKPVLKSIYNRIDDIEKLLGGSAEMFWRAAYPGLVLKPPTDADGVPMRFEDSGDSVAEQIKQYRMNLNRLHRVTGELEKLDTDVASPDDQIAVQVQDIAASIDIPMSIIRGNETGERATEQDLAMYYDYVARRMREHCENQILRPFIDRLLSWGVIPPTASGEGESYVVEWPSLGDPTEKEKAEIAAQWAKAFKDISAGSPNEIATAAERRQKLGMDAEYGSEAPDAPDPEDLAADSVEVPEEFDTPEMMPEAGGPDDETEESPEEESDN